MLRMRATRTIENAARRFGFVRVAGVDEVGRGCLAGPVMAGAVVLDSAAPIDGLRDSKQLSPKERDRLFDLIVERALGWAVAGVDPADIDRLCIQHASLAAMRAAVFGLSPLPDLVLVDCFRIPDLWIPQRGIVHGDSRSTAIAAASIVAKVTRDRYMVELHARDPRYGFDRHKGYGTPDHLAAIVRYGLSEAHRRTFRAPSLLDDVAVPGARDGSASRGGALRPIVVD